MRKTSRQRKSKIAYVAPPEAEVVQCAFCPVEKTAIRCDACAEPTCKHCSYFIDEDSFEFLTLLPEKLVHKTFCATCFHGGVSQEIDGLNEMLLRAKDINVFSIEQGKETRFLRRVEKPVRIENYEDRNEALICLAFMAVQRGFNTLVDLDLKSKKLSISGNYKKLVWSGSAVPINMYKNV
jgi:hypothetical protein